jgi:protein-L-isoaspartate(D-aspartate) O-methyltransferase
VTVIREGDAGSGRVPAEVLRARLVTALGERRAIRTDAVARAFQTVPRHLFAPEVPTETAYADDSIITKRDERGAAMSSVSAPWLQAVMLEQAGIRTGMRCLEIGSGGYNAALMAELAGESGQVTTVDIDPEVTSRAAGCLAEAGYHRVSVVLADAEHGAQEHAPFDRIIVTAGAWDIPPAWADQLSPGGRLVVPLRLLGLTRAVAFERQAGRLSSLGHEMCGFVPVQGAGARAERMVSLDGEDVGLRIDDELQIDEEGLRESLLQPRAEAWSAVQFGGAEPFDGLFLWLAGCLPGFCLLTRAPTATARRLADPSSPKGSPVLTAGRSLAYHTFRETGPGTGVFEFGAYAHGPDGAALAVQMCEQIRAWDRGHRHGSAARITVYPAGTPDDQLPPGRVIDKRHSRVVLSWP